MAEILKVEQRETIITLEFTQTEFNTLVACFGISDTDDVKRAGKHFDVSVLNAEQQTELYNKLRIHMASI